MIRHCFKGIFCLLLFQTNGFSQTTHPDTTFIAQSIQHSIALYTREIGGQTHLYNGSEYHEYKSVNGEDPYFINEWIEGEIYFDGNLYQKVPLLYDLSLDKIITEHHVSHQNILLVTDKVTYFVIQEHRFVLLRDKQIRPGFYELPYDGKTKVYIRNQKNFQETKLGSSLMYKKEFEKKTWFYIYKNGTFYQVKNKKAVLKVLRDHKNELVQFIDQNKIKFNSNFGKNIARLAKYFDDINH